MKHAMSWTGWVGSRVTAKLPNGERVTQISPQVEHLGRTDAPEAKLPHSPFSVVAEHLRRQSDIAGM